MKVQEKGFDFKVIFFVMRNKDFFHWLNSIL
jgi:hypothetical protein